MTLTEIMRLNIAYDLSKKGFWGKRDKKWYKDGSTIHKILTLNEETFFKSPRKISEIIQEFKSKDYHRLEKL